MLWGACSGHGAAVEADHSIHGPHTDHPRGGERERVSDSAPVYDLFAAIRTNSDSGGR
jgi:hypothetical protein